jgi:hypothetical protein
VLFNDARSAAADDDIACGTLAAAEWTSDDREDNWLISYADLLSVIFTMVVLLFGRMTVVAEQPAAEPAAPEPAAEVATRADGFGASDRAGARRRGGTRAQRSRVGSRSRSSCAAA